MGAYSDNLFKRGKAKAARAYTGERLVSVAIVRDDLTHHGFKSHAKLRASLGDEDPYTSRDSDMEGFWTSEGRVVSRDHAKRIGDAAGQCRPTVRPLLSSDITWEPKP